MAGWWGFALQRFWPCLGRPRLPDPAPRSSPGNCRDALWWPLIGLPGGPGGDGAGLHPVSRRCRPQVMGYGSVPYTPEKAALSSRYLSLQHHPPRPRRPCRQLPDPNMFPPLPFWARPISRLGIAERGKPLFTPALDGLGVLDVFPGGTGHRLGLRQGDVILAVNGQSLLPGDDLRWLPPGPLELLVRREEQEVMMWYPRHQGGPLGVLFVPLPWSPAYVELKGLRPGWLVRRLRSLWAEMAKKMRFRR